MHGHAVKAREDDDERDDGQDAQHDVHDAAVRDVGHVRDPGGKGRVVGRTADGGHDAVHDDEERHRETDAAADLPVAEERERRRRNAPEDVTPADEGAALAHAVRPRGAEDRRERGGDGAGRNGRGGRPAGGRDIFLNVGGKVDVFDHPGDLPDEAEHQQTRPDARAERRRLFDDQSIFHSVPPSVRCGHKKDTMRAGKRQPVSGAAAPAQGRKNFFKIFFFLCIKNESWRIITAERKQIRFSSDRARFPLKVVYRLFTTLPHTHKLLLALRRLRDTHAWAHSFLNAAFRSALFRAVSAVPAARRGGGNRPRAQRHKLPQDAKKARPIGRALFGAMIAIHTARVTLPLRRQRVHA